MLLWSKRKRLDNASKLFYDNCKRRKTNFHDVLSKTWLATYWGIKYTRYTTENYCSSTRTYLTCFEIQSILLDCLMKVSICTPQLSIRKSPRLKYYLPRITRTTSKLSNAAKFTRPNVTVSKLDYVKTIRLDRVRSIFYTVSYLRKAYKQILEKIVNFSRNTREAPQSQIFSKKWEYTKCSKY